MTNHTPNVVGIMLLTASTVLLFSGVCIGLGFFVASRSDKTQKVFWIGYAALCVVTAGLLGWSLLV